MASACYIGALRNIGRIGCQRNISKSVNIPYRHYSLSNIMAKHLTYNLQNGVSLITFNTPDSKVNSLSFEVMAEYHEAMQKFKNDSNAKAAVLISGKPDCFIAGADINMINGCKSLEDAQNISREAQNMLMDLEKSTKPVVAAIMGSCLGGGLEIALACHYRIAVKNKKTVLGLPEVMLGILPGGGGTQRLPKLVSIPNVLDMMLTGKNIRPDKAKKMGLVDRVIDPLGPGIDNPQTNTRNYLEKIAIETALGLSNGNIKREPRKMGLVDNITNKLIEYEFGRNYILKQARNKIMKMTFGNYPAPLKILEVVEETLKHGNEKGYEAEAKKFAELVMTKESNALIGLFHGQNYCKKNHFGNPPDIKKVGILGAGLMGAGITEVTMDKGYETIMKDVSDNGLSRGLQQIENNLNMRVKKKQLTNFEKDVLLSKLHSTTNYSGFKNVDLVIEAVFEDLAIKHKVIKEIETIIPEKCIFATNTSALPIEKIAQGSSRPEKVVGMHYFSPVDKMQLLEIITHKGTSKEAASAAIELGLKQGKTVITVGDGPGFYTTRILAFMMSELSHLFQEGVEPKRIDSLSKRFGWPVGAATLVDEVGIDVAAHVANSMTLAFGSRYTDSKADFIEKMVASGHLGRKTGKGVYVYEKGSKNKTENPDALQIIKSSIIPAKVELTDEHIQWRLASRFINEAVLCLEEGILPSPVEGDIGAVFGLGFPPFLGGPFRYLDNHGAKSLVDRMEIYRNAYGDSFKPCNLLYEHAKDSSKKFHKN